MRKRSKEKEMSLGGNRDHIPTEVSIKKKWFACINTCVWLNITDRYLF